MLWWACWRFICVEGLAEVALWQCQGCCPRMSVVRVVQVLCLFCCFLQSEHHEDAMVTKLELSGFSVNSLKCELALLWWLGCTGSIMSAAMRVWAHSDWYAVVAVVLTCMLRTLC